MLNASFPVGLGIVLGVVLYCGLLKLFEIIERKTAEEEENV